MAKKDIPEAKKKLQLAAKKFQADDLEFVRILTQRARRSHEVADIKNGHGICIVRRDIEEERITAVRKHAVKMGHPDPEWLVALFRMILTHSTATQVTHLEEAKKNNK